MEHIKHKGYFRTLSDLVPKEHKKSFGLYNEEEPVFNLSAAPKPKGPEEQENEPLSAEPPIESDAPDEEVGTKQETTWLIKKLVGILRYAGAMAVEVRGAIPDEAFEIVDKLQEELENIATSLEPYLLNEPEEDIEEEPEEESEPESVEEPESADKKTFKI